MNVYLFSNIYIVNKKFNNFSLVVHYLYFFYFGVLKIEKETMTL